MKLLCAFVVVCALIVVAPAHPFEDTHEYVYGLLIDAGSSGSRIYIYTWLKRTDTGLPDLQTAPLNQTAWSYKTSPGLGTFANNLGAIPKYLQPLIDYANAHLNTSLQSSTVLYLKATGGLRALAQSDQDNIMQATRAYLATTGYNFTSSWAQVIPLESEAFFGWMTVNYLTNSFGSPSSTVGALDMGGATTEIAFVPASPPVILNTSVLLDSTTYTVYTGGYAARGLDTALLLVLTQLATESGFTDFVNPCYLAGYTEVFNISGYSLTVTGSGSSDDCRALTSQVLLNTSGPCNYESCGFNGLYQPPLRGQFYAYSGYYYTYSVFFAPNTQISINDYLSASQTFCGLNIKAAQVQYPTQGLPYLKNYCFTSSYMIQLLDVYGFSGDSTNVNFVGTINGNEVSYAMGAMLYEANLLPVDYVITTTSTTGPDNTQTSTATVLAVLPVYLIFVILLTFIFA